MLFVLVAAAGAVFQTHFRKRLAIASPPVSRTIEPRLSGDTAWAPFRPLGALSLKDGEGSPARGASEASVVGTATATKAHVVGVAELLAGRPRLALSRLTAAAESTNAPSVWNDLAATLYENARKYDAPELLAEALAAVDRALALDSRLPAALFNRALIIERLGLRDDAREAWTKYLDRDATSDWANEAREHVRALAPEKSFLEILDREYDRVANDGAVAAALVARDPFGARGMGVVEVLGRWGQAVLRGDFRDADRHLRVARQLGAAAARADRDHMLERAVAAIDDADETTRSILASAHADHQGGLKAFQDNRPVDAEPMLRRAAAGFERARSPMVLGSLYFASCTRYEQGNRDAVERELEQLLPMATDDFPAYRAMLLWQLGICHGSRADWGAAITLLEQSALLFERLGEPQNAASVRRPLALVYDRIGDPSTAWTHRLAALRGVGGRSSLPLEKAVSSIAHAAMFRREWHVASSFLSLEIDIAHRLHDDVQLADTLLLRAVIRDRLEDPAGALADIAEAKLAIARTKDPVYRSFLRIAALRASALLTATPPHEADAMLTEAIDFQIARSDRMNLPGLFLERARARRDAGRPAASMADLQRGMEELERHRESLPKGEARWGAFHTADELFDDAIELAITTGDVEGAFRFAERARARGLLDSYGRPPVLDYRMLPAGAVVVEYAALPSRLIIFTADASGVRAVSVAHDRDQLGADIEALSRALRGTKVDAAKLAATAVYRRLVEPIAPSLMSPETVVFVPDSLTSTVAFSALIDPRGQYLVERHAIVVAASASAFAAAAERRREAPAPRSALVIAVSQAGADADALASVEAEADLIENAYPSASRVRNGGVQFDDLMARAPESDVIHFAGHAIGDDRGIEPASIVLRENGRERRVHVAEIAKLRLRRTATVVLAGCSTARGERRAAEGVISVAHGFLSAGASSVIATLWPIEDEAAARFFPRLHEKLAQGLPPAVALRAVQVESIRRGDVPASLWAAVQDIGS